MAQRNPADRPPDILSTRTPDYATFAGLVVMLGGLWGGLVLENGDLHDISRSTAALIVLGGTVGAVMLSTTIATLLLAFRQAAVVFVDESHDDRAVLECMLHYGTIARQGGILSLEKATLHVDHPFLRRGLLLAVDGVDSREIRRILELELRVMEDRASRAAHVFETAGGYAPTIGILGAVLGLIQVMKHLADMSEVGKGIASAFVATLYGVGFANLILLPAASKIRNRSVAEVSTREIMLEGIVAIADGMNPALIRAKLDGFLERRTPAEDPAAAALSPRPARS